MHQFGVCLKINRNWKVKITRGTVNVVLGGSPMRERKAYFDHMIRWKCRLEIYEWENLLRNLYMFFV